MLRQYQNTRECLHAGSVIHFPDDLHQPKVRASAADIFEDGSRVVDANQWSVKPVFNKNQFAVDN